MSDIDLTEACMAAIEGGSRVSPRHCSPEQYPAIVSEAAITAALPHIERQVREQVHHVFRSTPASQMVGVQKGRSQDYYDGVADALYWAAGIARGEQS